MAKKKKFNNEVNFLENQRTKVAKTIEALKKLQNSIDHKNFKITPQNINDLYEKYENVKKVLGNFDNDVGCIATIMVKFWLKDNGCDTEEFNCFESQNANGFDVDDVTKNGKPVIGELKTTIPVEKDGTKLGANQRKSIKNDLGYLMNGCKTKVDRKGSKPRYMFVTNKNTFEEIKKICQKNEYKNFDVILLGKEKACWSTKT